MCTLGQRPQGTMTFLRTATQCPLQDGLVARIFSPGLLSSYLPCYSSPVFGVSLGCRARVKGHGLVSFPWVSPPHLSSHWPQILPHIYCGVFSSQALRGRQQSPRSSEETRTHIGLFLDGGAMPPGPQVTPHQVNSPLSLFPKHLSLSLVLQIHTFFS